MKRVALFLACAATVFLTVVAAGSAATTAPSGRVQVTEAGGAKFPERAFVISLPTKRLLSADSVAVYENGQSVIGTTLTPVSAASGTTFGSVVIVDASQSMRGKPIAAAWAAARAFAARRNPKERLAFVTFNATPTVVLPFTTSAQQIDTALTQSPAIAYGTHIYDAIAKAEMLLSRAHVNSGAIVLLSDGADTGSTTTAAAVAKAARLNHIRIFTVGLHSPHFSPSTLKGVAASGGGEYALAESTRDLRPLFDQLGSRLASEYLLHYKSLAGPKQAVKVSVQVVGTGSATTAYQTPALPIKAPPPPYHPSLGSRIWGSAITMVVIALLTASVLVLLALGLLQPRNSGLARRMAEFVSVPGLQSHERRPGGASDEEAAKQDGRTGLLARLDEALEIAQINTSSATLVVGTIVGTAFAYLLLDLATGSPWWALLALLVPWVVREFVVRKLARRRKAFAEQLPDMLQVVSAALRAGQSFAGALAVVVESSTDPMKSEMQRVVADEQLGVPLERSVAVVVKRMKSRDLEQVALVAELQRESGGNAAEVVDRVAETIRERFELQRLINTLTIQGRMSRWIVSALPVGLLLALAVINPHYMHPLVSSLGGKILLGLAAALVVGGSLVIKKIVDIKV
jgi:Flp pilus assembly protein TadB/Mg-chelatase subunit ChlD